MNPDKACNPQAKKQPAKGLIILVSGLALFGGGVVWYSILSRRAEPLHDPRTPAGRDALKVQTKADWDDVRRRALARMDPAQKRRWMGVASNMVALEKTNSTLAYWTMSSNSVVLLNWMRTGRFDEPRL
jgi:hypothetical protein